MSHSSVPLQGVRVLVTGGNGFLGRVVCRRLREAGAREVLAPRRSDYDLTDRSATEQAFRQFAPDLVVHLAAEVGGIGANRANPGRFFYANMAMGLNVIEESRRQEVSKLIVVGTVCAYPKHTPVPFRETDLWQGYPEETNAPYGVAKRALLVMLAAYRQQYGLRGIYLLPVNLYGPGDNFDPETSHVIPALIRKCLVAKQSGHEAIDCWGTGAASREFLYVEDCAEGIVLAAEKYDGSDPVNLGSGREVTIRELANQIAEITGFRGEIHWDRSQPDGQPRRCLDVSRAEKYFDFRASTPLEEGLKSTIQWALSNSPALG